MALDRCDSPLPARLSSCPREALRAADHARNAVLVGRLRLGVPVSSHYLVPFAGYLCQGVAVACARRSGVVEKAGGLFAALDEWRLIRRYAVPNGMIPPTAIDLPHLVVGGRR